MNRKLHIDLETFCELELGDVGVHVYAAHPSFTVTAMAWTFDDLPVHSLVWPLTKNLPKEVWAHIAAGGDVHAHNTAFEHAVLTIYYRAPLPLEAMRCSMQKALVHGLPGKLGDAGRALGLSIVKDDSEKALMLAMAKPRKKGAPPWHECSPEKLERLRVYCVGDVEAERALDKAVPDLTAHEREVSLLDARANARGVTIDIATVCTLVAAASHAGDALNAEAKRLSNGLVTSPGTETQAVRTWLAGLGFVLEDLKKETVAHALTVMTPPPSARRMLEIRQLAAKSSLAKLERMIACTGPDFRARGLLQYAGAGRTWRWSGRLIQVQNLPRPKYNAEVALKAIEVEGGIVPALVYGDRALDVISSCIRSCLVAAPGHQLFSLDLSQIEARTLAWLASQKDILDAFRRGDDIYTYEARKQGSTNRQFGKVLVLGCGYGMGWAKFKDTAEKDYGVKLTGTQAVDAVAAWRRQNAAIVNFWGALQLAAVAATGNPGTIFFVGPYVRMVVRGRALKVEKPNGEVLFYHNPRIVNGRDFVFDGVDQKTKKWSEQRMYGGKWAENITQAVARDVLADAMLRVDAIVPLLLLSVHDEAVWELPPGSVVQGKVATKGLAGMIQTEFDRCPAWAPGLPIASEARLASRYGKG